MAVKQRGREYLVLFATLFLCFAVGEVVARAVVPSPLPWNWPQTLYQDSPSLGFRLRPNQLAYTADKPVRTNAMGFRGPQRSWEKPTGVRRILILGDSIAFGYGVAYQDSFARKLEEFLNSSGDRDSYEVIDTGVPGFNTLQEVTYFREEGLRLEPDVVILAVCWNDISDKSGVAVDPGGHLFDETTPDHGGRAGGAESSKGYWVRNLLKRSSALYFIVDRLRTVRARFGNEVSRESAVQLAVLTGQPHPAVAAGWAEVDRQLARLAMFCASRGIKLVVALLPMPQLLEGHYPHAQYPGQITRMCEKYGLKCVDLIPAFARQFAGHTSLFIPYDGDHPNERGHQIIAEQLYATLR